MSKPTLAPQRKRPKRLAKKIAKRFGLAHYDKEAITARHRRRFRVYAKTANFGGQLVTSQKQRRLGLNPTYAEKLGVKMEK